MDMNNKFIRKDYKHLMLHYDILFILLLIGMLILKYGTQKKFKICIL